MAGDIIGDFYILHFYIFQIFCMENVNLIIKIQPTEH